VEANPSPLKRRFSEVEQDLIPKVKTERSLSSGSNFSGTTSTTISNMKMDVDEETSKAASILKGVSMDARNAGPLPSPMALYPPSYCSPVWDPSLLASDLKDGAGSRSPFSRSNDALWLSSHFRSQ
jgi:hypothetical protein